VPAVLTRVHSVCPVGFDAASTAAAIRAGISALHESDEYVDVEGAPIKVADLPLVEDVTDDEELEDRVASVARVAREQRHTEGTPPQITGGAPLIHAVASRERPGVRFEGENLELLASLAETARPLVGEVSGEQIAEGNAAALTALEVAVRKLQRDPGRACVVIAIDSLLDERTLDWLELGERLLSASHGRNQAFAPGEAAACFVVEDAAVASAHGRPALAEISGIATAREPLPRSSGRSSRAEGLSKAVSAALRAGVRDVGTIDAVLADLNGEHNRAVEWALTQVRCLGRHKHALWHPADCIGDSGAASGGLLVNLAATWISRGFIRRALCVCSDDFGPRGAAVLSASTEAR